MTAVKRWRFELPAESGSDGWPTKRGLEVSSGGSQPIPSELDANAVRTRRDSRERPTRFNPPKQRRKKMITPREIIMDALADPKAGLDPVMHGYAPRCMTIERALASAGFVIVPKEPSEAMLNAARDWSIKKNGRGVGNDQAKGCWQAMIDASLR